MKNSITIRIIVQVLSLLFVHAACAAEPPISVEELAKILGYPADKMTVKDVTEDWNKAALRKDRETFTSAHYYTGDSASFAPISIGFAKEAALLTKERKQKMAESIEKLAVITAPYLATKWLSFEDVGYGASGFGFPGQGGSEERLWMTIYGKADVQIGIYFDKGPLEVLSGAESYNELVREGFYSEKGGLSGRLIEALTLIASKSAGRPITVTAGAVLPTNPPTPTFVPKQTPAEPVKTNKSNSNQVVKFVETSTRAPAPDEPAPSAATNSFSLNWLLIALVAFLGAMAAFVLLRRKF